MIEMTEEPRGTVILLRLGGRLDSLTSPQLETKLLALVEGGTRQLVLDLMNLDYISSAGLRVLLMVAKKLKAANGQVALAAMKSHIREIFDIAGFSTIFPIHDQIDAAIQSFNG